VDASGNIYLPMSRQPKPVFGATRDQMREVYDRAMKRNMRFTIYTELFKTITTTTTAPRSRRSIQRT
jgi:hypothetical protein